MSTLKTVIKLSGVLASVSLAGAIGLVKCFAILFSDDDAERTVSYPAMQMGETAAGTVEPAIINDDHVAAGAMSGEPIVRNL